VVKKQPPEWCGYSTEIGEDGFPTDPKHPFNLQADVTPEEARARHIRRELRRFRMSWEAGVSVALRDAVRFCNMWDIAPPDWVVNGVSSLISGEAPKRRIGRGSHAEDMKDFTRWDHVVTLREHLKLNGEWQSWDDCYWRVSTYLEGKPEEGAEDTIKKAYQRVEKRMRENPGRYYI